MSFRVRVQKQTLKEAADAGVIREDEVEPLWEHLKQKDQGKTKMLSNAAFLLGFVLVLVGMFLIFIQIIDVWEIGGATLCSLVYSGVFFGACYWFKTQATKEIEIAPGVFAFCGIFTVTGFVCAFLGWTDLWADNATGWFYLEAMVVNLLEMGLTVLVMQHVPWILLNLLIAGPALLIPVWCAGVFRGDIDFNYVEDLWPVWILVGAGYTYVVYRLDVYNIGVQAKTPTQTVRNHGLFYSLFAVGVFLVIFIYLWASETLPDWACILLYPFVIILFLAVGALFRRGAYTVGALVGTYLYLAKIAFSILDNPLFLGLVFSGLGVAVIYIGIVVFKRRAALDRTLHRVLPSPVMTRMPMYMVANPIPLGTYQHQPFGTPQPTAHTVNGMVDGMVGMDGMPVTHVDATWNGQA
ncbi:hypothetical protein KIPB_001691 [Kipferlia bialata]|uniref:DUF2157 domain-containing protein n=1 Tax=Kipferlia bialata TaxID=797122 RepID=A0A9K3CPB9_9EUKA|nr:hypothetical protein KIPB_001691 [Kipferlia bialata]|eukprot:g1691.t1